MDGLEWKTLKWMIWGYPYFRKHASIYLLQLGSPHIRETESALGLLESFGTSSEGGLNFVWKEIVFQVLPSDLFGCVK